jgi:hypothetical protein
MTLPRKKALLPALVTRPDMHTVMLSRPYVLLFSPHGKRGVQTMVREEKENRRLLRVETPIPYGGA